MVPSNVTRWPTFKFNFSLGIFSATAPVVSCSTSKSRLVSTRVTVPVKCTSQGLRKSVAERVPSCITFVTQRPASAGWRDEKSTAAQGSPQANANSGKVEVVGNPINVPKLVAGVRDALMVAT